LKEKAVSCAGLRVLRLTFSPAWLRNFVAACGLARSTAAYDGGFGSTEQQWLNVAIQCYFVEQDLRWTLSMKWNQ